MVIDDDSEGLVLVVPFTDGSTGDVVSGELVVSGCSGVVELKMVAIW